MVIGILIAIQINNWNQAKIVKEKERLAVIEILTDLEYNIGDLESIKSDQVRTVKELETLIVTMESNTPYHDSLGVYFYRTSYYDEVAFKISGYNSLNSIGMDLIEDSKIRSSIGQYFTSSIGDLKGAYQEVVKDFHEYMLPYHRKEFTTINMFKGDRAMIPNNYVVLKNNKEFIQSLKIYHEVQSLYLKTLIGNLDIAILLKQDIEGYINE